MVDFGRPISFLVGKRQRYGGETSPEEAHTRNDGAFDTSYRHASTTVVTGRRSSEAIFR